MKPGEYLAVWMQRSARWRCGLCNAEVNTGLGMYRHLDAAHRYPAHGVKHELVDGGTFLVAIAAEKPRVLLELRGMIPASGKAISRWSCELPECDFSHEHLSVSMLHLLQRHGIDMDLQVYEPGSNVVVLQSHKT